MLKNSILERKRYIFMTSNLELYYSTTFEIIHSSDNFHQQSMDLNQFEGKNWIGCVKKIQAEST